jgi:hypothetical protein
LKHELKQRGEEGWGAGGISDEHFLYYSEKSFAHFTFPGAAA